MIFKTSCVGHEDLNGQLLDLIYSERERDRKGVERSNFSRLGGWHSRNNLHNDRAYDPLIKRIDQAAERISALLGYDTRKTLPIGSMWSIINPPGSMNKSHIHPHSHWSGVYYVQAPEHSGDIEFTDPRTAHVMNEPSFAPDKERSTENWTKVRFTPDAGKMLIFPSWLYHSVAPNMAQTAGPESDRVIVSFNMEQVGR